MDLSAQPSRADSAAEIASASPSIGHGTSAPRHTQAAPARSPAPSLSAIVPLDVDDKPSRKSSFVADRAAEAPVYQPPVYHGCQFFVSCAYTHLSRPR